RGGVALRSPDGAVARAEVVTGDDPRVAVEVSCGEVLDEVVLRSYCIGATHMALGWVTSEGLAVDDEGRVHDLTIRSFGILRAVDMPPVDVTLEREASGPPVNGSDAVFAAGAAAAWLAQGAPRAWPTGARLRSPPPRARPAGYRRRRCPRLRSPSAPTRPSSAPGGGSSCPARSASPTAGSWRAA